MYEKECFFKTENIIINTEECGNINILRNKSHCHLSYPSLVGILNDHIR